MKQIILDSYGKKFQQIVYEDSKERFEAQLEELGRNREWVGIITCTYDKLGNMIIHDLQIIENCRRRGLGASLLNLAKNSAKTKGKKHIYGSIVPDDISEKPDLIQFYEKRGFVKCGNYPGCLPNATVYIRMDLD